LFIWGIIALFYYIATGGNGTHKSFKTLAFAGSGFAIGLISLLFIEYKFDDEMVRKKAYLIAHSLDFNANLNCPGQELNGKGVFLGANQSRLIFDEKMPSMPWVEAVYANEKDLKDIVIPESFEIYGCNQN
jgi:hypothetical protein